MCVLKAYVFLYELYVLNIIFSVESHFRCPFPPHQHYDRFHALQYKPALRRNIGTADTDTANSLYIRNPSTDNVNVVDSPRRTASRPTSNTNAGIPCAPQKLRCHSKSMYYSYDGSCNNLQNLSWGQSETHYNRFLPANYSDGKCALRKASKGYDLFSARIIRTTKLQDREILSRKFNILYYDFGQWVDHDVTGFLSMETQSDCCTNGRQTRSQSDTCLPIVILEGDTFYSQFRVTCLDLKRGNNTYTLKCDLDKPCVPINFQTAMLDLSILLGPNLRTVNDLRLSKGGLLKFINDSMTKYQLFPPIVNGAANCPFGGIDSKPGGFCWRSGVKLS